MATPAHELFEVIRTLNHYDSIQAPDVLPGPFGFSSQNSTSGHMSLPLDKIGVDVIRAQAKVAIWSWYVCK